MTSEACPFDRKNIKRILVRAVNWLGDAVLTTPAIDAIRSSFPAARITLLATPLVAELFSPHDRIDEVLIYYKKGCHAGLGGRLRLAGELRARRFRPGDPSAERLRCGAHCLAGKNPGAHRISDGRTRVPSQPWLFLSGETKKLHHVEYYLRMLAHFGIVPGSKTLSLTVTAEEEREAAALLHGAGIEADDFLLGLNPGATYGSAKRWYPERFAAVADELCERWGGKAIITGGPDERGIADEIEAATKVKCLNLAGQTSVRQLMALTNRCDFFITNDSGPMHIAAAFKVPLVAIFGPTDHTTTSPFSEKAIVVSRDVECAPCLLRKCPTDHRCMKGVRVDDVVAAASKLRETTGYHR